ncbi:MAG TPA: helix-turn-helix domain-containing protein [Gaiellaceae bacterium]|nr:helix-turn-helix domain-containing protein [Gaiellaceae bacterium]
MERSYRQYCPVAHALDLVGERWSLLIVRDLLEHGPLRYSDLNCRLTGCGTNILADRLKKLERHGIVRRRQLPPPAAATVYELTPHGAQLRSVLHELAHWGARSLGPPGPEDALQEGWLAGALRIVLPPGLEGCVEFRADGQVATLVAGDVREGSAGEPDAVVSGDPEGLYRLLVDRDLDAVAIEGDRAAVAALLEALPPQPAEQPAGFAA